MVAKDWRESLSHWREPSPQQESLGDESGLVTKQASLGDEHPLGYEAALRLYACELEGSFGALSTMRQARAAIALFDACRAGKAEYAGGTMRGSGTWRGASSLQLTAADSSNLLVCFACAAQQPAADGVDASPFAAAVHKVGAVACRVTCA